MLLTMAWVDTTIFLIKKKKDIIIFLLKTDLGPYGVYLV